MGTRPRATHRVWCSIKDAGIIERETPTPFENEQAQRQTKKENGKEREDKTNSSLLLAWLAMYQIFSPNSRIGLVSLRPRTLWNGVFPSLPISRLFIRYAANSSPRCHTPGPFGPFLPVPLPALYPSNRSHTRLRMTCRCSCPNHCVVFASCVATVPRSIGTGPSSAIITEKKNKFSMISSNFLGRVRNSRLVSFGIISLTTNVSCASSVALN